MRDFVLSNIAGIFLAFCMAIASIFIASLDSVELLHISPLIIGVCFGILLSSLYRTNPIFYNKMEIGIGFSAKKILRLGIILYGFNVSLNDISYVGVIGVLLSIVVVVSVLLIGFFVGTKILKLDRDLAILVSVGSAICGVAAVLATESSIKSDAYKSVIAVGSVVVFGLLGMFVYPVLYRLGFIPFDFIQEGLYIGITLHEVANVVGAGNAISPECASYALIVKMIRVMLLVPMLLIMPFLLQKFFCDDKPQAKGKLHIPWFAIGFMAVIVLHSVIDFSIAIIIEIGKLLCVLFLTMSMCALGLQIDFKKFISLGGSAFKLAFLLSIVLFVGGFILIYLLSLTHII